MLGTEQNFGVLRNLYRCRAEWIACEMESGLENCVINHVKDNRRRKPASLLEQKRVCHAQQRDGQPGERRMIDRKKGSAANHRALAAPFPVQSPEKQSAEEILLRQRSEHHRHDGI